MSGYLLFGALVLVGILVLLISDRLHRQQPYAGIPRVSVLCYTSAGKGRNLPTLRPRFGNITSQVRLVGCVIVASGA
jgi:hypothetical protein